MNSTNNIQVPTPYRLNDAIKNYHQNKHLSKKKPKPPIKKIPRELIKKTSEYLCYKGQIDLAFTCTWFLGKPQVRTNNRGRTPHRLDNAIEDYHPKSKPPEPPYIRYFNITILKENFKKDTNKYLTDCKIKNEDGTLKPINRIQEDIRFKRITLPKKGYPLEYIVKQVLSNQNDTQIYNFITEIKERVAPEQLVQLCSTALEKMSDEKAIKDLIIDIKVHVTPEQLDQFSSTALEKMSDEMVIKDLIIGIGINGNVNGNRLYCFSSTALEKISNDFYIVDLIGGIKDQVSQDQIVQLALTALEKMSNEMAIVDLIVSVKENVNGDRLFCLALPALQKLSDKIAIFSLIDLIKDSVTQEQLNQLASHALPKIKDHYNCITRAYGEALINRAIDVCPFVKPNLISPQALLLEIKNELLDKIIETGNPISGEEALIIAKAISNGIFGNPISDDVALIIANAIVIGKFGNPVSIDTYFVLDSCCKKGKFNNLNPENKTALLTKLKENLKELI